MEVVMRQAESIGAKQGKNYIHAYHLLLALASDNRVGKVLKQYGIRSVTLEIGGGAYNVLLQVLAHMGTVYAFFHNKYCLV